MVVRAGAGGSKLDGEIVEVGEVGRGAVSPPGTLARLRGREPEGTRDPDCSAGHRSRIRREDVEGRRDWVDRTSRCRRLPRRNSTGAGRVCAFPANAPDPLRAPPRPLLPEGSSSPCTSAAQYASSTGSSLATTCRASSSREVWPMASIPVLRDDEAEVMVPETTIIIEYSTASRPTAPPMIPADADEALEARRVGPLPRPVRTTTPGPDGSSSTRSSPRSSRTPRPSTTRGGRSTPPTTCWRAISPSGDPRRRVRFPRSPTAPLRRRCSTPGFRDRGTSAGGASEPSTLLPRPRPPPVLRRSSTRRGPTGTSIRCRGQRNPDRCHAKASAKDRRPTAEQVLERRYSVGSDRPRRSPRRTRGGRGRGLDATGSPAARTARR